MRIRSGWREGGVGIGNRGILWKWVEMCRCCIEICAVVNDAVLIQDYLIGRLHSCTAPKYVNVNSGHVQPKSSSPSQLNHKSVVMYLQPTGNWHLKPTLQPLLHLQSTTPTIISRPHHHHSHCRYDSKPHNQPNLHHHGPFHSTTHLPI